MKNTLFELCICLSKNHFRLSQIGGIIKFEKGFPPYSAYPILCVILITEKLEVRVVKGKFPKAKQILALNQIDIEQIRLSINRNFLLNAWVD